VRGASLVAQPFDAGSLKLGREPFPIAEPVRTGSNGAADFSVSANGVLVYAAGGSLQGQFMWVDRAGKELGAIETGGLSNVLSPALSPDGHRVAFRVQDPQLRTRDIWLADLTRGVPSRFTFDPGNENHPVWSPDGRRIAYWCDVKTAPGIYLKDASGAGEAQRITPSDDETVLTDWSRDGRTLMFTRTPTSGRSEIWSVPVEGDHKPVNFTRGPFDYGDARLSPDGQWLSYTSTESGRPEVYVQTFPVHTGKWQISTSGGADARWNANGKEIVYLAADQHMMSVSVRTQPSFEADVPKSLFTSHLLFPGIGVRTHYELSADAQRFLMAVPRGSEALSGANVVLNWNAETHR
jgi:dipeptidyl aminopeptidase/acylaminoacyl peptidase